MTRSVILALALLAAAPLAEARDVSGEMAYRERMALPDGAELRVELRSPEGLVAEATILPEGRQVPLPFLLVAPDTGAFTLLGAIFVNGRPEWVSAPVAIAEGDGAINLGLVPLVRHVAVGSMIRMRCGATVIEAGLWCGKRSRPDRRADAGPAADHQRIGRALF